MTQEITNIYGAGIAGAALVEGDIVKFDTDGTIIKVTSAEATDAIGVVYADASAGQKVSVIVSGLATVRVLVEDTDGASGYDAPIVRGSLLVISGKVGGTYLVGQAFSAVGGTAPAAVTAGEVVGKALEAVAGSATADTYTTIKAFVNFMN